MAQELEPPAKIEPGATTPSGRGGRRPRIGQQRQKSSLTSAWLTGATSMRQSIFNDGFFKGLDRSVGDVNKAEALPPACYADPDFFEFEKEAIFNHEWLC